MDLQKWMDENDMSQTDMANALGTYPCRISTLLSGKYAPKAEFARQIRDFTKNKVTLDDIYDIPLQILDKKFKKNQKITENDIKGLPAEVIELLFEMRNLLIIIKDYFENEKKDLLQETISEINA